ncbi:MAG: hypothetical protein AAFN11_01200 [Chloroflexota bacterium]
MSPILEVLIGMVFVYSLLSILVTQINKLISTSLRLRAKHLRGAFDEIIHDEEIRAKVVTHPLIRLMDKDMVLPNQRLTKEQIDEILDSGVNLVEWVDPETFVNVLSTVIKVDHDRELYGALLDIVDGMPDGEERRRLRRMVDTVVDTGEGVEELKTYISEMTQKAHKNALIKMINDITAEIGNTNFEGKSNIALMAGIRKINNVYFRESMKAILSTSQTLEEAETKIAKWFDDSMDRTSQAFKGAMVYLSLAVSCVLALVLNIDSLHLAQTLWDDPALRDTVIAAVEQADITELELTEAEASNIPEDTDESNTDEVVDSVTDAGADVVTTLEQISSLRLPIGWAFDNLSDGDVGDEAFIGNSRYLWNYVPTNNPDWWQLLLLKILGIGATMVAIAQGAPFWFGILHRLSGGSSS